MFFRGGFFPRFFRRFVPGLAAAFVASATCPASVDAAAPHASGAVTKKGGERAEPPAPLGRLLGTLVDIHGDARIPLDDASPSDARFAMLLADRVTGEAKDPDPRLLDLLRALARRHQEAGPVRIEIVSGYRSPKRNETMRKKGHHVASHSQHSLGHACDFRVVPAGSADDKGIDPRVLEKEIRDLGWDGGVGVYTLESDWFVHADVGRHRRWDG